MSTFIDDHNHACLCNYYKTQGNNSANFIPMDTNKHLIEQELLDFLRKHLLAKEIEFDINTELSSVGIDSLSTVEILLFIERNFGIMIPDEQLDRQTLRSVLTIVQCVCGILADNQ